jgi:hypothetical protein
MVEYAFFELHRLAHVGGMKELTLRFGHMAAHRAHDAHDCLLAARLRAPVRDDLPVESHTPADQTTSEMRT